MELDGCWITRIASSQFTSAALILRLSGKIKPLIRYEFLTSLYKSSASLYSMNSYEPSYLSRASANSLDT